MDELHNNCRSEEPVVIIILTFNPSFWGGRKSHLIRPTPLNTLLIQQYLNTAVPLNV